MQISIFDVAAVTVLPTNILDIGEAPTDHLNAYTFETDSVRCKIQFISTILRQNLALSGQNTSVLLTKAKKPRNLKEWDRFHFNFTASLCKVKS